MEPLRKGRYVVAKPVKETKSKAAGRTIDQEMEELFATVCYYYPQYTLKSIRRLPYRQVKLLSKMGQRLEAIKYLNLLQISQAPHTKKGEGVKKMAEHYRSIINGK